MVLFFENSLSIRQDVNGKGCKNFMFFVRAHYCFMSIRRNNPDRFQQDSNEAEITPSAEKSPGTFFHQLGFMGNLSLLESG